MLGRVCATYGVAPTEYLRGGKTLADLHVDLAVCLAYTRKRVVERGESLGEFLSQSGNKRTPENVTAQVLKWLGITS